MIKRTLKNPQGFTLIELMVVIAIIAILSIIGIAVYSGVQDKARDARRRSDVDAIAKALEIAKSTNYSSIASGTVFAGGVVPTDSANGSATYCVWSRTGSTTIAGPSSAWTTSTCPTISGATANSITSSAVTLVASATNWTVCAALEDTTTPYCISSTQ